MPASHGRRRGVDGLPQERGPATSSATSPAGRPRPRWPAPPPTWQATRPATRGSGRLPQERDDRRLQSSCSGGRGADQLSNIASTELRLCTALMRRRARPPVEPRAPFCPRRAAAGIHGPLQDGNGHSQPHERFCATSSRLSLWNDKECWQMATERWHRRSWSARSSAPQHGKGHSAHGSGPRDGSSERDTDVTAGIGGRDLPSR